VTGPPPRGRVLARRTLIGRCGAARRTWRAQSADFRRDALWRERCNAAVRRAALEGHSIMGIRIRGWLTTALLGGLVSACGSSSPAGGGAATYGSGDGGPGVDAGAVAEDAATGDAGTSIGPADDSGTADAATGAAADGGDGAAPSTTRVVAYLPNYSGSYADWATKIDFSKMTHLNLAFALATSSNGWDMGAADADVAALVKVAHAAGVKVLASLGGGGGDQSVIARFKDPSNVGALVANLDAFVAAHDFDGVDVDIEDPNNLGQAYTTFVDAVVAKLRPEGKLVTVAVAQYLQDSMQDATLHEFDFVNVMIYSNYSDSVSALDYYTGTKAVPKTLLTLGAGFFGQDSGGNEYAYSDILKADPNAWSYDQTQVNGNTVNYTGMASMKKLAEYSKGFGGIMFWELSEDTADDHSLYKVIQSTM
jgi:hypothetical protein